jgi:hypothetical protein
MASSTFGLPAGWKLSSNPLGSLLGYLRLYYRSWTRRLADGLAQRENRLTEPQTQPRDFSTGTSAEGRWRLLQYSQEHRG